jgi:serine/threonine protein phosphatase PrpC
LMRADCKIDFNNVNFKFAVSQNILKQSARGIAGCTDFFGRIWKVFVDCLKSCLNCFSLCSKKKNTTYEREFRIIQDASQIRVRLARQMDHARQQMLREALLTPFEYRAAPTDWDMHQELVGGYSVGISHALGRRPTMEDEHLATSFNLTIAGRNYPIQLFGIFDGHSGREAAQYVRDHLKVKLQEALIEFNAQGLSDAGIWKALKMTSVRLNRDFKNDHRDPHSYSGTTATIALILDQKLWTANVGDARTVLDNYGTSVRLTEDAKPSDPRYRQGIEKRGGCVEEVRGVARINRRLAVARAIGDHHLNGAVSARPKVTVKPLSEIRPGSHLILCCDGVYDVASTRDVVRAAYENRVLSAGNLARNIVYSAYQSGSEDNLSAMVIKI